MADAGLFYKKTKPLTVWQTGDPRGLDKPMEGLEPAPGDTVIVKKFASAFFGTTLASELHYLNVDTLVICGVSTSGCVRATTLDAMQSGFRPMVIFRLPLPCLYTNRRPRLLDLPVEIVRRRYITRICSISIPNMPMSCLKNPRWKSSKLDGSNVDG